MRSVHAKIVHVFPNFDVGGSQVRFVTMAHALLNKVDHHVISLNGAYACATRVNGNVSMTYGPTPEVSTSFIKRVSKSRSFLRDVEPDLLMTYNWGAIEWAAANMVPFCRHIHIEDGFGPDEANVQHRRRVWFRRVVLGRHSNIVVPSRTLHKIACEKWRLPKKRLHYIPNGIDTKRFIPSSGVILHHQLGLQPQTPIVGTVTRLGPEKNLVRLVEAFSIVRAEQLCHLVIVGDGPERGKVEQVINERGLNDSVHLIGYYKNPEAILPSFSVYGLSSDTEQMPLGVLEAMACGVPIAAVDVGDTSVMVSALNKPFIVERDSKALAASIASLTSNHETARSIGIANRAKIEELYCVERMIGRYQALFDASLRGDSQGWSRIDELDHYECDRPFW